MKSAGTPVSPQTWLGGVCSRVVAKSSRNTSLVGQKCDILQVYMYLFRTARLSQLERYAFLSL